MSKSRNIAWGAGTLGLLITLGVYRLAYPGAAASAAAPERDQVTQRSRSGPSNELSALRLAQQRANTEVIQLRRELELLKAERSTETGEEETSQPTEPEPKPTSQERQALSLARLTRKNEYYANLHQDEARDPSWSEAHERELYEFFGSEALAGNTLESADCAQTHCRLMIRHASAEAREALSAAWGNGAFAFGGYFQHDPATDTTIVYLGREGHAFPRFRDPAPGSL